MKRKLIKITVALWLAGLFVAGMPTVYALTLDEAIIRALNNDPTFLAAKDSVNASRARSSQAFARLMPQLNISANSNDNRRDYTALNAQGNSTPEYYSSHGTQVNLSQSLFHVEKFSALNQSELLISQAEYQLAAAENDLMVRLVQAWLDIRQAEDVLVASESKLRVSGQELDLARRANEQGIMSGTEFEAVVARYDQTGAELIAAQTEQLIKLAVLEQIIGSTDHPSFGLFSARFATLDPDMKTIQQWIVQAEYGNPSLMAARRALDAADEEVYKQQSGHFPTLELVATHNQSTQGSGLIGGQAGFHNVVNSIGVQLNASLFSSGEQSAKVSEALAMRAKASHELEATRRAVHLKIKQAWLSWKASYAHQKSGEQAAHSAINALQSDDAQRAHGLKADLDVLQAQQKWDEVRRDQHKARNDSILSYFKLLAEAGRLSESEVLEMEGKNTSIFQLHSEE